MTCVSMDLNTYICFTRKAPCILADVYNGNYMFLLNTAWSLSGLMELCVNSMVSTVAVLLTYEVLWYLL
jgi:hypothetical protein